MAPAKSKGWGESFKPNSTVPAAGLLASLYAAQGAPGSATWPFIYRSSPADHLFTDLGKLEDEEESTPPSSPPVVAVRRSKWDDEEEEDSEVLESWSAAEDSEVEREKVKTEAAQKAKAEAEAAANKKSRSQRIAEKQAQNKARAAEADDSSEEEEDEADRRRRLQRTEQDSDLKHAEDLFGTVGISNKRTAAKAVVTADPKDPTTAIDLSSLTLFNPANKASFTKLRETLVPILTASSKKAHYPLFLQEFTRDLTKELQSSEIKAIASKLTTLSNEKMKEEKLAEKGGKKSKAAKTKTSLVASRDESSKADTTSYENEYDE
ncbi:MAG: Translation initiation factor 3 subunit J component [Geoglossum umbratile]|nr:MAG: Translation initiation factor 3 subunit J component [Geoglossum umbratile]